MARKASTPSAVQFAPPPASKPSKPGKTPKTPRPRRKRIPLLRDLYYGAILGDFAPEIGLVGAATLIILGFTPGIGSICALRDALADAEHNDPLGVVLNAMALVPVLGGIPKAADAIRSLHHVGRIIHVSAHRSDNGVSATEQPDDQPLRQAGPATIGPVYRPSDPDASHRS